MRYVTSLLTIAVLVMEGLPGAYGQRIHNMGALPPEVNQAPRPDLESPAEVDLFKRPRPDGDKEETETQKALKKVAPELFRTEAVVVTFGAEWCRYCKAQIRDLRGPSLTYNVLAYDVEDEKGNGKAVADYLKIGRSVPVTCIIEKGRIVKSFEGFTPWATIKPHAKKAKKNDKDQEGDLKIGPLNIDWDDNGVDINWDRERRRR